MKKEDRLKFIPTYDQKDVEKRDTLVQKRKSLDIKNTLFSVGVAAAGGYVGHLAYNFSSNAHPMRAMACAIGTGVALSVFAYVNVRGIVKHKRYSKSINNLNNSFIQRIEERYDSKDYSKADHKIKNLVIRSHQGYQYKPYMEVNGLLAAHKEVLNEKRNALIAYGVYTKQQEKTVSKDIAEADRVMKRYINFSNKYSRQ